MLGLVSIAMLCACQQSTNAQTSGSSGTQRSMFENAPVKSRKQMVLQIAANEVDCYGAFGPRKCLSAVFPDGHDEHLMDGIRGYTHVKGKAQKLLVERIKYDTSDPTRFPQDISSIQYRLVKVMR